LQMGILMMIPILSIKTKQTIVFLCWFITAGTFLFPMLWDTRPFDYDARENKIPECSRRQ
jgi:hypothetical protein